MSDIPEFLDAKEIACAFGKSLATVKRYANEPDFPDPFEWSPNKVKSLQNGGHRLVLEPETEERCLRRLKTCDV